MATPWQVDPKELFQAIIPGHMLPHIYSWVPFASELPSDITSCADVQGKHAGSAAQIHFIFTCFISFHEGN